MRLFVVIRDSGHLRAVKVYTEDEGRKSELAAEFAELEGYAVRTFYGEDLADVMASSPSWFDEEAA